MPYQSSVPAGHSGPSLRPSRRASLTFGGRRRRQLDVVVEQMRRDALKINFYLDVKKVGRRLIPRCPERPNLVQVFYTTYIPGVPISPLESS